MERAELQGKDISVANSIHEKPFAVIPLSFLKSTFFLKIPPSYKCNFNLIPVGEGSLQKSQGKLSEKQEMK